MPFLEVRALLGSLSLAPNIQPLLEAHFEKDQMDIEITHGAHRGIIGRIMACAELTLAEIIEQRKSAWSVRELAELLNVGKRSVYDWIDAGRLQAYKMGGVTRLDPKSTAAWLRARLTTN